MTNADKYEEVFGMPVDKSNCPTSDCIQCPCADVADDHAVHCVARCVFEWWDQEYDV